MLIAAGMTVLGAGYDWYQQEALYSQQEAAARQQFKIQEQQRLDEYMLAQQQVAKANAYTLKIWDHQLEMYEKQLEWNRDAFHIASADYQIQFNDQLAAAMVESQAMEQARIQSSGSVAASGSTSSSALLAEAIESEGEYGRQKAIQQQNIIGQQEGLRRALEEVARQTNIANEQAYANVAVPPELQTIGAYKPGQYIAPQAPNPYMTGFNSALAGLQFAAPLVPEGGDDDWLQNMWGAYG